MDRTLAPTSSYCPVMEDADRFLVLRPRRKLVCSRKTPHLGATDLSFRRESERALLMAVFTSLSETHNWRMTRTMEPRRRDEAYLGVRKAGASCQTLKACSLQRKDSNTDLDPKFLKVAPCISPRVDPGGFFFFFFTYLVCLTTDYSNQLTPLKSLMVVKDSLLQTCTIDEILSVSRILCWNIFLACFNLRFRRCSVQATHTVCSLLHKAGKT